MAIASFEPQEEEDVTSSRENMPISPKNVQLETKQQILHHAHNIYLQSAISHAMPPGNLTYMEKEERKIISNWYNLKK